MGTSEEDALEQELAAAPGPRLTTIDIDNVIVAAQYHVFPGTTLTVCAITLKNGFVVTGASAPLSPENFSEEIGQRIAFANARERIWNFEGYLLRQKLSDQS